MNLTNLRGLWRDRKEKKQFWKRSDSKEGPKGVQKGSKRGPKGVQKVVKKVQICHQVRKDPKMSENVYGYKKGLKWV